MLGKPYFIVNPHVNWTWLSRNPNAIPILEQNIDKVDWRILSMNPNAIPILEKNLDKIDWNELSINPNAVHLIEKQLQGFNWVNTYYQIIKKHYRDIFSEYNMRNLYYNIKYIIKGALKDAFKLYVYGNALIYMINYKFNSNIKYKTTSASYAIGVSLGLFIGSGMSLFRNINKNIKHYYINWYGL